MSYEQCSFSESGKLQGFSASDGPKRGVWNPYRRPLAHFPGHRVRTFSAKLQNSPKKCNRRRRNRRNFGKYDRCAARNKNVVSEDDQVFLKPSTNDWFLNFSRPLSAECLAKSKLSGLLQQPQAPNNTTQFLITDREERESCDREMGPSGSADLMQMSGPSSSSTSARLSGESLEPLARDRCHTAPARPNSKNCAMRGGERTSAESIDTTTSDGDDNEPEEDIEDPEFAAMYDDYNFERIKSLSRDQVNREMLVTQKENLHLTEKVSLLKSENQRLRSLLGEHGIEFAQPLNFSFRKSNPNSPDNTTRNFEDDDDENSHQDDDDETSIQVDKDPAAISSLIE